MRYSALLSPLAVISAASTAMVSAQSLLPLPQFEAVFAGYFNVSAHFSTAGPYGTRVHNAFSGGSMSNVTTGEVVATVLPFADDGVSSNAGPFFPGAVMPLSWEADGSFASVSTSGVRGGSEHRSWEYAHVETDSPAYAWMNTKFFIVRINSTDPAQLTFIMYEESSSSATASSSS